MYQSGIIIRIPDALNNFFPSIDVHVRLSRMCDDYKSLNFLFPISIRMSACDSLSLAIYVFITKAT
jgi:hypothetical protein